MSQSGLNLVNFRIGTSDRYVATTKDPNTLYFLSDTHQIMKGEDDYTSSIFIVDALPDNPIKGKIYIVDKTASAYQMVDGSYQWVELYNIKTIEDRIDALDTKVDTIDVRDKHLSFDSVAAAEAAINAEDAKGIYAGKRITINADGVYNSYVVQTTENGKYAVVPMSSASLMWYDIN